MTTKRFDDNPGLKAYTGTEVIPMQSKAGGTATDDSPVAIDDDVKISLRDLAGLKIHTVPVASGTATLEAACLGLPYCLTYKVAWLTAMVARRVMSVRYLGIVNVMADREVVKELLQERAQGRSIAAELDRLLSDRNARDTLQHDLAAVVGLLGEGGSHERAAAAVAAAWEVPS